MIDSDACIDTMQLHTALVFLQFQVSDNLRVGQSVPGRLSNLCFRFIGSNEFIDVGHRDHTVHFAHKYVLGALQCSLLLVHGMHVHIDLIGREWLMRVTRCTRDNVENGIGMDVERL